MSLTKRIGYARPNDKMTAGTDVVSDRKAGDILFSSAHRALNRRVSSLGMPVVKEEGKLYVLERPVIDLSYVSNGSGYIAAQEHDNGKSYAETSDIADYADHLGRSLIRAIQFHFDNEKWGSYVYVAGCSDAYVLTGLRSDEVDREINSESSMPLRVSMKGAFTYGDFAKILEGFVDEKSLQDIVNRIVYEKTKREFEFRGLGISTALGQFEEIQNSLGAWGINVTGCLSKYAKELLAAQGPGIAALYRTGLSDCLDVLEGRKDEMDTGVEYDLFSRQLKEKQGVQAEPQGAIGAIRKAMELCDIADTLTEKGMEGEGLSRGEMRFLYSYYLSGPLSKTFS